MVDKGLVMRKISQLEIYGRQVSEYAGITLAEYQADWKTQRVVERTLQMMIETCADIAAHLIADSAMRVPTTYADTFRVLFENGIIGDDTFSVMEKMAKFRNIVVHQYEAVDAEIVLLILRKHLDDFDSFKRAVLQNLGTGT